MRPEPSPSLICARRGASSGSGTHNGRQRPALAATTLALALALPWWWAGARGDNGNNPSTPTADQDAAPSAISPPPDAGEFSSVIAPILAAHCIECHGEDQQEAGLRLDLFENFDSGDRHLWTKIFERVRNEEMPPEDRPLPAAGETAALLGWIERQQQATASGGMRRLNRREFSGALRHLTGLEVDFAGALPGDGRMAGFDTGADALQDAADSVSQGMEVARRAVDGLRFLEPPRSRLLTLDLRETTDARRAFDAWRDDDMRRARVDAIPNPGTGLMLRPKWIGERGGLELHLPPPPGRKGLITLTVSVEVFKPHEGIANPRLWVRIGGDAVAFEEITAHPDRPQRLSYTVSIDDLAIGSDGLGITLTNMVETPYQVAGFDNEDRSREDDPVPGGTGLFRPAFDRRELPWEEHPVPYIVVRDMEVEIDHAAPWPPAHWPEANEGRLAELLEWRRTAELAAARATALESTNGDPDRQSAAADEDQPEPDAGPTADGIALPDPDTLDAWADELLALWIRRAWRRPLPPGDHQRFLAFHRQLLADGLEFDDALRATFQAVLLSPEFRYLPSPALAATTTAAANGRAADSPPPDRHGHHDETAAQHAIASRLAFMLTAEPPDAPLRELAAEGRLRQPDVLAAQVERLLADPRSRAFIEPFVVQWLEMDQPITIAMGHMQQQDFRFARYLKESMREETIAYMHRMFTGNRPAREILASNWTMMNDILARHYGYDDGGPADGRLRHVRLRRDDPRGGGILSHAGIQSMLTWMGDNWVIYRGAWTLRHILDMPPPPPPLEIPDLFPFDPEHRGLSLREVLFQHQNDRNCAICHRTMDPLGFAFQNFDLSGRWRDLEYERYSRSELDGKIAWHGVGESRPVDAAGRLPRGEEFADYQEFQRLLVRHYQDDLVRGLARHLLLYATGRLPEVDDMNEISAIMEKLEPDRHPLRDLLTGIVQSPAFLDR